MIIRILYGKPKMRFPLGSWLIRAVEGTEGSHVAIEIVGKHNSAVFDSVMPRSRLISIHRWNEKYTTIRAWAFDVSQTPFQVFDWALDNTDKEYSRLQCILIGMAELFEGVVKKIIRKLNPNGNDYLICVEAVSRFLIKFADFKFDASPDTIGLKEFVEKLDKK